MILAERTVRQLCRVEDAAQFRAATNGNINTVQNTRLK